MPVGHEVMASSTGLSFVAGCVAESPAGSSAARAGGADSSAARAGGADVVSAGFASSGWTTCKIKDAASSGVAAERKAARKSLRTSDRDSFANNFI